jgi:hypothetical protein
MPDPAFGPRSAATAGHRALALGRAERGTTSHAFALHGYHPLLDCIDRPVQADRPMAPRAWRGEASTLAPPNGHGSKAQFRAPCKLGCARFPAQSQASGRWRSRVGLPIISSRKERDEPLLVGFRPFMVRLEQIQLDACANVRVRARDGGVIANRDRSRRPRGQEKQPAAVGIRCAA